MSASPLLLADAPPRGRRSLRSPPPRAPERTCPLQRAAHVPTVTHRGDLLALVVALAVLGLSAVAIDASSVSAAEREVFRVVNEDVTLPYAPVWLLMQLGSVVAIYAMAALAAAYRRFRLTVALLLAGTAAWWLAKVVKAVLERPRPSDLLHGVVLRHAPTEGLGFVSGHAAVAAALAGAAWPFLGRRARALAVAMVVVVGLARIYVGAHLPLDVVGGVGLGLAIAAVVRFVVTPEPHRPPVQPGGDSGR